MYLAERVTWRCSVTKLFSIEHLRTVDFANFDQTLHLALITLLLLYTWSSTSCSYGDPQWFWEKLVKKGEKSKIL